MDNLVVVPYVQGRNQIQDGDIIFIANKKKISSHIVEFFTKSHLSHVCIAFWLHEGGGINRLLAVGAQGGNERYIINLSSFQNHCQLYVVKPTKAWADVRQAALAQLGHVKYSWYEAAYVGFREFLMTRFNITIKEKDFSGEICSEFVARIFDLTDILISPQLLYTELMKVTSVRIVLQST